MTASSNLDIDGELQVTSGTLAIAGLNADVAGITNVDGTLSLTTGIFTANGLSDVDGTLSIEGIGTYNADGQFTADGGGAVTFTAEGNLVCSNSSDNTFGTLTSTLGKVTFDAAISQALPDETFHDLTVNNAGNLTMANDVQVDGDLDFTSGYVITNNNKLVIGSSGTISNATDAAHVNVINPNGYLSKIFGSASSFSFPVGNGSILRPIDLTTDAASTFDVRYDAEKFTAGGGNLLAASGALGSGWNAGGHISGYANNNSTDDGGADNIPPIPVSKGYHYNISRSAGGANATLTVNWTDSDQFGSDGPGTPALPANVTGITWAEWNGAAWDVIASNPTGTIDAGQVNTTGVVDFSLTNFTLGSLDGSNYLPIDLVSFDGECIDNKINLEFVVASQVNNDYFTIKRSKNNLEWEVLGYINGGGTNNEEITYTWTDYSPKSGVNYYKLFQTDIDGISKSFSPIAINCESNVEDYHIYPNPTNDRVSVEFELEYYQGDDIQMVLKDFKGVIVKSNPIELKRGYNYFEVDLSNIPNGFYVLSYSGTKNHIPSKRIVKL